MRRVPVAALLLSGCAYISDEDEKWRLDPDGDGAPIGQDCDDNDASATDPVTFFTDADGDGFGDPDTEQTACTFPAGAADNGDDCDDTDADVFPDAPDAWYDGVDSDCAGDDDFDQDGDGYGVEVDCDDTDASLAPDPGVAETWFNGVDDNCDITDQDGDQDGDGYWAADYAARVAANDASPLPIPDGKAGDCWDDPSATPEEQEVVSGAAALTADQVNPGAAETFYDGADQDCEGEDADGNGVDDDFDQDGDGQASLDHPDASGAVGTDCDDTDANAYRGADEIWYDGVDQSCKGTSDYDADGDLYDSDAHGGLDCDDEDPSVYPDAYDTWYDNVDSDCSGGSDFDADADGEDAADWAAGGTDCDDTDPTINAAATEVWYDGVDQDCDGASDYDADRDGYDSEVALAGGGDCDDAEPLANPGETEVCGDGFDNDCDGSGAGCGVYGELDTADAITSFQGSQSDTQLGWNIASDGDLSGDGAADVAVGAPYADLAATTAGLVAVFSSVPTSSTTDASAGWRVLGDSATDLFGYDVALGDFDGDGQADLVAGAPSDDLGAVSGGAAFVFLGPLSGGASSTRASNVADNVQYATTSANAGISVASAGDQDSDGRDELLVGAFNHGGANGAVYIAALGGSGTFTRLDDEVVLTSLDYDNLGEDVDGGRDVDGDGTDDLLVGARYHTNGAGSRAGAAYVVHGPVTTSTDITSVGVAIEGPTASGYLGDTVRLADDLDGDGLDDILIGAPFAGSNAGGVYVVFGPATTSRNPSSTRDVAIEPAGADAYCGSSVDGSGDLDGDGNPDLVVGCSLATPAGSSARTGKAYVFYGPLSAGTLLTTDAAASLEGAAGGDYFGAAIATVDDMDGDGESELAVSAHSATGAQGPDAGTVSLFPGGSW